MSHKTVAFITVHIGINVGSNLQAIATSEVLKKAGYDPILVNYIPPRVTSKRYWRDAFRSPKKLIWRFINFPSYFYQNLLFRNYLAKYTKQTHPIYADDDFAELLPKVDVYITGSDQVWNFKWNEGFDGHYFFQGIHGRKIAYAASIGMDSLTDLEQDMLKQELDNYEKISVREAKAVKLLSEIGFDSIQVIDPTLMLNCQQWRAYIKKRIVKIPYILVYTPYNIKDKEQIYKTVRSVANAKGLQVVTFSWDYWGERLADKTIFYASPGEFLSLMYYADYVVTNSFHGTAFSINLNKQFWVYAPSMFSSRVSSIIRLLGLDNRMVDGYITTEAIDDNIDYDKVNQKLDVERARAMSFLKDL